MKENSKNEMYTLKQLMAAFNAGRETITDVRVVLGDDIYRDEVPKYSDFKEWFNKKIKNHNP